MDEQTPLPSPDYTELEADANKAHRDLMRRVFAAGRTPVPPPPKEFVLCPRCNKHWPIPPHRKLCRNCWEELGRPDGHRETPTCHVPGSVPGMRRHPTESSEIAYHGGKFNAGEW